MGEVFSGDLEGPKTQKFFFCLNHGQPEKYATVLCNFPLMENLAVFIPGPLK